MKDLSGKTVHDLELEDFEKLFCFRCRFLKTDYCRQPDSEMEFCKRLIDCGFWDRVYRNN